MINCRRPTAIADLAVVDQLGLLVDTVFAMSNHLPDKLTLYPGQMAAWGGHGDYGCPEK